MTNQEAIKRIKEHIAIHKYRESHAIHIVDALEMAISALRAQDVPDTNVGDMVSRQKAIDTLAEHMPRSLTPDGSHLADECIFMAQEIYADCIKTIEILPSAEPEAARRIVGKSRDGMTLWYQCDMCNEPVDKQDAYCRGCGRRFVDE